MAMISKTKLKSETFMIKTEYLVNHGTLQQCHAGLQKTEKSLGNITQFKATNSMMDGEVGGN
jgi:hypothetical protein